MVEFRSKCTSVFNSLEEYLFLISIELTLMKVGKLLSFCQLLPVLAVKKICVNNSQASTY